MPTLAKPLTKRAIDALASAARDAFYWEGGDGAVKGFGLRVWPSGRKAFVFQYDDVGGRTRRLTLGEFGALTVEQARDAARQAYAAASAAKRDGAASDPATRAKRAKSDARAAQQAPTVQALFACYLEDRARKGKRAHTLAQYRRIVETTIGPAFGARKLADVTRRDVAALHASMSATPYMANRVFTLLRAMFAYAEREELRPPHTNPCTGIEKYPEVPRARALSDAQYAAIGAALARASREGLPIPDELRTPSEQRVRARQLATGRSRVPTERAPWDPRTVALFRFLALSGWRESEARSLRWADLDLGRGVAILGETKTGRSVRPLGRAALDVLEAMPHDDGAVYVFPGVKDGAHRANVRRPWMLVRHAAGLRTTSDTERTARLHDLRHGFTTVARGLGYGDHVIAALVGHAVRGGMTSRYGDVPDALVRKAADDIAVAVAAALTRGSGVAQAGGETRRSDQAEIPTPVAPKLGAR